MPPKYSAHVHDDAVPIYTHLRTVADSQPFPVSIGHPAKLQQQVTPPRLRKAVHNQGQRLLVAEARFTHHAIGRFWSDGLYGQWVLRGRRRRSGRAASGLRSRLLRVAKWVVVYEYPRAVEVAHIQVVIVVERGRVRHGAEIVHVAGRVHIRPQRVVVHSNKPRPAVGVVPHNHPIRAIERRFPSSCLQAIPVRGRGYSNYHVLFKTTRPQNVVVLHRVDEYLRSMWGKDSLRVRRGGQFLGKDE